MNPIERAATHSAWAHLPVAEKLLLFGGLLVLALVLPTWPAAAIIFAVVAIAVGLARVPLRLFAVAVLGPALFIAIGVIPVAVDIVGGLRHGVWFPPSGIQRATTTALRAISASAATVGLACTTTMASLLAAARRIGVPPQLCHLADMTYRLVGILIATARSLRDTITLRLGFVHRAHAINALGSQFATVFVQSMSRSRRMADARALRAEPGSTAVATAPTRPSLVRICGILATLTGVVAATVALVATQVSSPLCVLSGCSR